MEFVEIQYNKPEKCESCGGIMIFKGVGEYKCEECGKVAYDDYGKVRCYIEQNHGATAAQIEAAIGVKQKVIRQMLKESRLEVSETSKAFLQCEICGANVRSGRYCPTCEAMKKRLVEDERKRQNQNQNNVQGFGKSKEAESGAKRFRRE